MPHRIEPSPSGRARCRACRAGIAKGDLRFAESVPNPVADGDTSHFYHLPCASERRPGPFAELLASDAREQLAASIEGLAELEAAAARARAHHRLERLGEIERAKSGRAKCRHCRQVIEKQSLRIALQPIEDGMMQAWGFLHLGCVPGYVGTHPDPERLTRYSALSDEDLAEARSLAAAGSIDSGSDGGAPATEAGAPESRPLGDDD
jgi:hypothetical protein